MQPTHHYDASLLLSDPKVQWRVLPSNGPGNGAGAGLGPVVGFRTASPTPSTSYALATKGTRYENPDSPGIYTAQMLGSSTGDASASLLFGTAAAADVGVGTVGSSSRGKRFSLKDQRTEAEVELEARRVYSKLLAVPKYKAYREGLHKKGRGAEGGIWPDSIEFTLVRAIVRYKPCWRERKPKLGSDDGKYGRNQLVSDVILRATGESRNRKQISSHLQVLKAMVGEDRFLTPYLVSAEAKRSKRGKVSKRKRASDGDEVDEGEENFREQSPDPLPLENLRLDRIPNEIRCSLFEMALCPTNPKHDVLGPPLHTYTRSADGPYQTPLQLADVAHCLEHYPELGIINLELDTFANVPIVCGDVSLAPPRRRSFPGRNDLAIKFILDGPRVPDATRLVVQTTIFENGEPVYYNKNAGNMELSTHATVQMTTKGNLEMPMCKYQIPFLSDQWVRRLHQWGKATDEVREYEFSPLGSDEHKDSRAFHVDYLQQQVASQIGGLNAVQEICVGNDTDGRLKPIMLVHWSFRQTLPGQAGRTLWRDIEIRRRDQSTASTNGVAQALHMFDQARPSTNFLPRAREIDEYETLTAQPSSSMSGPVPMPGSEAMAFAEASVQDELWPLRAHLGHEMPRGYESSEYMTRDMTLPSQASDLWYNQGIDGGHAQVTGPFYGQMPTGHALDGTDTWQGVGRVAMLPSNAGRTIPMMPSMMDSMGLGNRDNEAVEDLGTMKRIKREIE